MGELLDLVMTTGTSVISTTMNTLGINKKVCHSNINLMYT